MGGSDVVEAPRHPLYGNISAKARFKSHQSQSAVELNNSERQEAESRTVKLPPVSADTSPMAASLIMSSPQGASSPAAGRPRLEGSQSVPALTVTRPVKELD